MSEPMSQAVVQLSSLLEVPAAVLAEILPEPIYELSDDQLAEEVRAAGFGLWFGAGGPMSVVVGLDRNDLVVGIPEIHWHSQDPVIYLASCSALNRFEPSEMLLPWFAERVAEAVRIRRATFQECQRCNETQPPERMFDDEICQGCAADDGVVF